MGGGIGAPELLLVFLVVLLLFGGKKLPEVARGLGKGLNEFKKARDDIKSAIDEESDSDERSKSHGGYDNKTTNESDSKTDSSGDASEDARQNN
jgi:sec-independent protein translocase protein TatA